MRILPHDMEQGLKEFASGVEQLVDRLVSTPILREGKSSHTELSADQVPSTRTLPLQNLCHPYHATIASYCSSGRC